MSDPIECSHPANGLLPWYLNGSLEGPEQAAVREHLGACPVCSHEIDVLATLGRGLRSKDLEVPVLSGDAQIPVEDVAAAAEGPFEPAGGRARAGLVPIHLAHVLAAGLALPAALGLWWALLGFPGAGGEPTAPEGLLRRAVPRSSRISPVPTAPDRPAAAPLQQTLVFDLKDGLRGAGTSVPSLTIPPGVESVAIRFSVPVNPDARYTIALRGAGGTLLRREDQRLVLDEMGRSLITVAAETLRTSGIYDLVVVEEVSSAGAPREFRFTLRIGAPAVDSSD